jgi:hypothetical protein
MIIEQNPPGRYHIRDMAPEEFATICAVLESVKEEYNYAPCDEPKVHRLHTWIFLVWAQLEIFRKESNNVRTGIGQALRERLTHA